VEISVSSGNNVVPLRLNDSILSILRAHRGRGNPDLSKIPCGVFGEMEQYNLAAGDSTLCVKSPDETHIQDEGIRKKVYQKLYPKEQEAILHQD